MHKINKKVYYHDTDCGGIVYYANYLKYFEEARTEFFLSRGIELTGGDFFFVVKSLNISYRRPARYGQVIEVKTDLVQVKNASLLFNQTVELENIILVSAETKIACINKNFQASLIPEVVVNRLKK